MTLVSMKVSKPLVPDGDRASTLMGGGMTEEYPWGLRISLEKEQLAALGITEMPAIGTEMSITATVKVCSLSDDPRSMSLQITALELKGAAGEKNESAVAERMYTAPIGGVAT